MRKAASQIEDKTGLVEFEHFLSHNELELALDELEGVGDSCPVDEDFWWSLKKCAQVMGLKESRLRFARKYQQARQGTGA